jgi:hypothetical protein
MNEFIKQHLPKLNKANDEDTDEYKVFNANHSVKKFDPVHGYLTTFINTLITLDAPGIYIFVHALRKAETEADRKRICKLYYKWLEE